MLFFTISNLKSAKTYKSQQVLVSRKTVYSSISKLTLQSPYFFHILCTIISMYFLCTELPHCPAGTQRSRGHPIMVLFWSRRPGP